ncbi:MAG: L-seryl-tRNA(Sec) selenium transferase [Candidatus Poribacteria bacterium]
MELCNNMNNKTRSSLRKVINVTGTVIHTNFGRSLLSKEAIQSIELVCKNYISLEYDIESGQRGHRDKLTEDLIKELTGCEASIVVNNNASAVFLCLNTLAKGREVIVSRGELIEIGGSFRIPDVMQSSGAILREVGTTNRTYIKDYLNAINENTALLLKVHTSNYRLEGYVTSVHTDEIVALGKEKNIPVMEDLGSGALIDLSKYGLPKEPIVKDSIEAGVDIVTFSGDKLLGGPQSGIIVGKEKFIKVIRNNPLMRCVRICKMTISALETTLRMYIDGKEEQIPSIAMITRPIDEIRNVAQEITKKLRPILNGIAEVWDQGGNSQVGSGALPVESIRSWYVALRPISMSVEKLAELFRNVEIPIIGRINEGCLLMDMRTVYNNEMNDLIKMAESIRIELKK